MKWMMMLSGFVVFAFMGTIGSGVLMLSTMNNSYGGIFVFFLAPVIGLACGLFGVRSGYLAYKKEYIGAATLPVVLAFSIAIAVLGLMT